MTANSPEEGDAPQTRQMLRGLRLSEITNRIVSASASLIAIAALATAVYQARLSRDQAKAAVLPYLILGNSGNNGYARIVQNVGLGPALIRAFEVTVDSVPVHTWKEVADSMHISLSWKGHRGTTFAPGLLVPAGATIDLIELPDSNDAKLFRAGVDTHHLTTWVCYCSVYGDCWEQSRYGAPKPTKVCNDVPSRRFGD